MVTHYFTLLALAKELQTALNEQSIAEVYSYKRNILWLSFSATQKENKQISLCISIDPTFNYCYLRDGYSRAKKNSVDLFSDLVGSRLLHLLVVSYNRILRLEFSNGITLYIKLYDTSDSNVILVDENNTILEAFKNNKLLHGTHFGVNNNRFDTQILKNSALFTQSLRSQPLQSILHTLKTILPILGSIISRELLLRAGVHENATVDTLSEEQLASISFHLHHILTETENPSPRVYQQENEHNIFSIIPLAQFHRGGQTIFQSVNEGVQSFVFFTLSVRSFDDEKKRLMHKLQLGHNRVQRSVLLMTKQLSDSKLSDQYELFGKILLANIHSLTQGVSEVDLPDFSQDNSLIHIQLDAKFTPSQNAERYFERAKKAKYALLETERRLSRAQKVMLLISELLDVVSKCYTIDQLKDFAKSHSKELTTMNIVSEKQEGEQPPFRIFVVAGGFEVWVGKNSANNDLLTTKYAKPHDIWFHARGASGSHTVLKTSRDKSPSKEVIFQAARIAAYYSKMRKANNVPVAYCERKYVRKPKGVPAGTVTLERETVIFVKPRLPVNSPNVKNS